ncbi:sensor histidine kinase [Streptomyces antarcticus]|uniref:sensor histidine kinase n=1 Tax=Streptomyces antarcticus TaxID=2996458 RepID=UPI002270A7CD|nr:MULTISPECIES: PAS domain-containing sensor histidine kinase [unclassified Streptomyces]MCY0945140.1 PAS domain-containing sensor histidine kinase [Streptomyces sp. H34-AA3]MCY0952448.1 PAS domain-containing sensor histidine kinase [Streptomyces sp. H27-S2]MCZ4085896.1 PAS domain-containing sensor histidine kinase [Streptomyces sp. H34-S5]
MTVGTNSSPQAGTATGPAAERVQDVRAALAGVPPQAGPARPAPEGGADGPRTGARQGRAASRTPVPYAPPGPKPEYDAGAAAESGAPGPGVPVGPGPGDAAGERLGGGIDPDDLPDGLVVADDSGRVICFNLAAARMTATDPARALGTRIDSALPLEDLEGRRWWALTDPYGGLATRRGQPERNLLLPGGREVLVSARYVRTHPTGPLRRLVVTLRGTEARRRTERSHAELIATVAHELRSPLTSVKGFTATLLAKWERFTDDQKRLMLETVDADANRVTRLIAELLDISRIDSGRLEVRRQPVDIGTAVARHVQALTANGQTPERFLVSVCRPLPDLWADPDKIDQILGNLLENAVRHGEGTVTIEVTPHEKGTAVTVTDEGSGIPEESMGRVFTRFWRGSKRGGTGLGLYIVKGIVEAHGGTIAVGRGPGGGAEFRFILPVSAPAYLTQ